MTTITMIKRENNITHIISTSNNNDKNNDKKNNNDNEQTQQWQNWTLTIARTTTLIHKHTTLQKGVGFGFEAGQVLHVAENRRDDVHSAHPKAVAK